VDLERLMEINTLYYGDNLKILRKYIPDNSIDLIYLDPPFNSKATYNVLFKEPTGEPSQAQITAFEDTWHWGNESEQTFQKIVDTAPANVVEMARAFRAFIGKNDMMAYLVMMCIRLLELKRVLKDSGSIYLHCDPTAGHYLRVTMDTIFNVSNIISEIVWGYGTPSGGRTMGRKPVKGHDILLVYAKEYGKHTYHKIFTPYSDKYISERFTFVDEQGRIYRTRKREGGIITRQYLDESPGVPLSDTWTDIKQLYAYHLIKRKEEELGYPTQKPLALLERIVQVSSNEGDIVLDPFCGCGTALVAAQKLSRKWVGIDITHLAISNMKWRLNKIFPGIEYKVVGEPVDITGARELANENQYQFQWWALSLIGARPYGDKKRGADTGIDGYVYFMDEKEKIKKAIVQVKSGGVSVNQIRDLWGVIGRERAEMGIFITLEPPSKPMETEAISQGFYRSPLGKDYPKMQILTIDELLKGKKPDIPPWVSPIQAPPRFKQAKGISVRRML